MSFTQALQYRELTPPKKPENVNPLAATVKSAVFFLGGLFFAWNLLLVYGFSTMVDPALPDQQRNQEIVRRFLFGDGIPHTVFVVGLFAGALICFALCAMNLWSRVTGVQKGTRNSKISIATLVLALIVLGLIYFALA